MEDDNNFNFNFLLGGNFSLQNWYVLLHTMFHQKIGPLNFRNVHKTLDFRQEKCAVVISNTSVETVTLTLYAVMVKKSKTK